MLTTLEQELSAMDVGGWNMPHLHLFFRDSNHISSVREDHVALTKALVTSEEGKPWQLQSRCQSQ